ncbi:hypothetical protein PCANB_000984 [Pneumocystis canis]|nr:hypothetical protein PCANB_000984 [Pneumocystis canis]
MNATFWDGTASLLLAQLVLRYGDSDFSIIQNHLDQHPLLRRPAVPASDLEAHYEPILGPDVPLSAPIRELCRLLHSARIAELKMQIQHEEEAFARLVNEINIIRAGKWPECQESPSPALAIETKTSDIVCTIEDTTNNTKEVSIPTLNNDTEICTVNESNEIPNIESDDILVEKTPDNVSTPALSVKIERKNRSETPDSTKTAIETDLKTSTITTLSPHRTSSEKESKILDEKRNNSSDNIKNTKKSGVKKSARGSSKKEEIVETWQSETSGDNAHRMPTPEVVALKRFQNMIMPLWMSLSQHKHGTVFMAPVSNKDAPGYSNLIYFPTDMKSIRNKIRDGKITTSKQFHREILLLFANAIMYNGEDSTIAQWAKEGFAYSEEMISMFMQTESIVDGAKELEEIPKLKRKKAM